MKKILLKFSLYFFLILIALEILTRVFYLAKDTPLRHIDNLGVEKWNPNQTGYSVTGNRNQNFSAFRINSSGFNSYREFTPSKEKHELALVGDSFFQGFHQDFYNSIGSKIEKNIPNLEVYEYGYAGYDFADQLHLINAYKKDFDLIDQVVIYLHFPDDLHRGTYYKIMDRVQLQSPLNLTLQKSKLLVYFKSIGILDPPKNLIIKLLNSLNKKTVPKQVSTTQNETKNTLFTKNFKQLVSTYGFDKNKFTLLLDSKITPKEFLDYLDNNQFKYIDFHSKFKASKARTNLIYDQHWNDHGRELIAKLISDRVSLQIGN